MMMVMSVGLHSVLWLMLTLASLVFAWGTELISLTTFCCWGRQAETQYRAIVRLGGVKLKILGTMVMAVIAVTMLMPVSSMTFFSMTVSMSMPVSVTVAMPVTPIEKCMRIEHDLVY